MIERLSSRHLVLLGIGHTNAHILRMWQMNPIPDTDLTCIDMHFQPSPRHLLRDDASRFGWSGIA